MATLYYVSPINGNFASAADWTTFNVPGIADIAKMTVAGTYTVTYNSTTPTTVLGICTGADTTFDDVEVFTALEGTAGGANLGKIDLEDGAVLTLGGTFNNVGGSIDVATGGQVTTLDFLPGATLKGGMIGMSGTSSEISGAFTNVGGFIQGAGTINATINNQGLGIIVADVGAEPLTVTGPITNAGGLEAVGGGELDIQGNVTNTAAGEIFSDLGSTVAVSNARITGGALTGGGDFNVSGDVTLDGSNVFVSTNKMITLDAPVLVAPNTNVTLLGTININNNISVGGAGALDLTGTESSPSFLFVGAAGSLRQVTLEGRGLVNLGDDTLASGITGTGPNAPVVTLVNVNNTITGAGIIGGGNMALNNESGGLIEATATNPLIIDTGPNTVTNAGTLAALNFGSSELFIGSALVNTGHLISFGSKSTVIAAAPVTGTGSAIIDGNGVVEFAAASSNGTKFSAGSTGELILDDSKQYTGTISGFGANTTQSIDLADFNFTGAHATSFASGVLTLKNTAGQVVHLHISGTHTLASFQLSNDGNFNGTDDSTKIVDPPAPTKPQKPPINLAGLFGQFMASWTSPTTALMSEAHSPLASELQTAISLPHAQGFH